MEPASSINQVCELLAGGDLDAAAHLLKTEYPPALPQTFRSTWTAARCMRVYLRDGFTDRYSGAPLVFPGTLRAISLLLPKEFPYQTNWKQSETHPAFWELSPTIDHIRPLARGGSDEDSNVVTTSMVRNAAKANWTLEELGWPAERAPVVANWDGLLAPFFRMYERFEAVRSNPRTKEWYRVARNAT